MSKIVGCENENMSNACSHCIFTPSTEDCNEYIELFRLDKVYVKVCVKPLGVQA